MGNSQSTTSNASEEVRNPVEVAGVECGHPTLQLLDDVQYMVRDVLKQWQHPADAAERRSCQRIPFQKSIALFAIDSETEQPTGEPYLVTGKDISINGVGFSHENPLPFNRVAVGFELPNGCSQFVLVRLSWCRFTRRGVYESGGMFIRPITPPANLQLDWSNMRRI